VPESPTLIDCTRCGTSAPALDRPPFRNSRGETIHARICQGCWADWLKHQTQLINHYGLDPRDPEAREFLYTQIDEVLLGGGSGAQVDPSKEGTVEW
jgi:Fe-S cluster biosynthesis and repair protein YggX